ncbi:hypothetical protein M0R72_12075 [Candidatus Pacearchaeota archaeon]|nr:hypothetical protein [Candidatus Pacearchaeota archaeon]
MSKKNRCSICAHKKRKQIDQSVADGVSYRRIAEVFGVGEKSVERHVNNGHVLKDIEAAATENQIDRGAALQKKLDTAYDLALEAARKAKKQDLKAFGGCISGVLKALELEVRITIPEERNVNLNVSGQSIDERLDALAARRRERKSSTNQ